MRLGRVALALSTWVTCRTSNLLPLLEFVPAGMANILAALAQHAPQLSSGAAITSSSILPMKTVEDLEAWERLDDVIMVRCVMISVSES